MSIKISKNKDINLGKKMRCQITGFEGIATSKIEYLNGCFQYCLKPQVDKDGKVLDGEWVDVEQLEIVKEKKVETGRTNVGGDNKADTPQL